MEPRMEPAPGDAAPAKRRSAIVIQQANRARVARKVVAEKRCAKHSNEHRIEQKSDLVEEETSYGDDDFEPPAATDAFEEEEEDEHYSYASDEFEAARSPHQLRQKNSVEILMALERHLEEELALERKLTKLRAENTQTKKKASPSRHARKKRYSTSSSTSKKTSPPQAARSRLALAYESVLGTPDLLPDLDMTSTPRKAPFTTCTLGKGTIHSLHNKSAPAIGFSKVPRGSSGDTRLLFFSNLDSHGRSWAVGNKRAKQLTNATRRMANQIITIDAAASTQMQATGEVDSIYMLPCSIGKQIEGRGHRNNAPRAIMAISKRTQIAKSQTLLGAGDQKICSGLGDDAIPGPGKYDHQPQKKGIQHSFDLSAPRKLDPRTAQVEHRPHRRGLGVFEHGRPNPANAEKGPPLFYDNTHKSIFDSTSMNGAARFGTSTRDDEPSIGTFDDDERAVLKELKDEARLSHRDLMQQAKHRRSLARSRDRALYSFSKKGATFGSVASRYTYAGLGRDDAPLSLPEQLARARKIVYEKHLRKAKRGGKGQRKGARNHLEHGEYYDIAVGPQRLSTKRSEPRLSFSKTPK